MPEITSEHVLTYLLEIGPAASGAAGPAPITHGEIRAWQENTGIALSAWEARTLRQLSREYVGELIAGADRERAAPYTQQPDVEHVAHDLRAAISGLAKL